MAPIRSMSMSASGCARRGSSPGLSQEELGDGIGVSFQAVQKYEQGENRLSASRLFRAAKLLRQPVSFFFDVLEADPPAAAAAAFSRDEIDLVRHFRLIRDQGVRDHLLQCHQAIGEFGGGATGSIQEAVKPA